MCILKRFSVLEVYPVEESGLQTLGFSLSHLHVGSLQPSPGPQTLPVLLAFSLALAPCSTAAITHSPAFLLTSVSHSCCYGANHSILGGCRKPPFIWVTIPGVGDLGCSELDGSFGLASAELLGQLGLAGRGWSQLEKLGSALRLSHPPSAQLSLFTRR